MHIMFKLEDLPDSCPTCGYTSTDILKYSFHLLDEDNGWVEVDKHGDFIISKNKKKQSKAVETVKSSTPATTPSSFTETIVITGELVDNEYNEYIESQNIMHEFLYGGNRKSSKKKSR